MERSREKERSTQLLNQGLRGLPHDRTGIGAPQAEGSRGQAGRPCVGVVLQMCL